MNIVNTIDLHRYKVSPLTMIFLLDRDKILTLQRNSDKNIYPNKLSGFGGKVEPGEDLIASAHREFMEETGLTIKNLSLRGTYIRILDNGYINEIYLFIAKGYKGQITEITREGIVKWLRITDFLQSSNIVDHVPLYLNQIIEGRDFYCGIGTYMQDKRVSYTDNTSHFDERR